MRVVRQKPRPKIASAVTTAGWAKRPDEPESGYEPSQAIYLTLAYRTSPRLVGYSQIYTTDMEVIKEQGTPAYYTLESYYPEGFRSASATETTPAADATASAAPVRSSNARGKSQKKL